jgi:hypothetical protein
MAAHTPNETLTRLLADLSWSAERLACEINRLLGAGAVASTAPYHWLKGGRPRREEVRSAAVFALSQASGRPVTVAELWPDSALQPSHLIPAVVGMEVPWTLAGTVMVAHDWLLGGLMDRRAFLAVTGAALTSMAWTPVKNETARLAAALNGDPI